VKILSRRPGRSCMQFTSLWNWKGNNEPSDSCTSSHRARNILKKKKKKKKNALGCDIYKYIFCVVVLLLDVTVQVYIW